MSPIQFPVSRLYLTPSLAPCSYVALTTLLRVVQSNEAGSDAVQRHRAVIIDCLRVGS